MTESDVGSGSLLLSTEVAGLFVEAPRVDTEVQIQVQGMMVRGFVRQSFRNPTAFWVEGKYVFPLPDDAAVDGLRMATNGHVIEGEIQEKSAAKEAYEEAKVDGYQASLVEQDKPNVFRAAVANLGPGETIAIEISYLQTLRWVDDGYRLRFPTVVAPRYDGHPAAEPGPSAAMAELPRVILDCAEVVAGRLIEDRDHTNSLSIEVTLDGGGPLERIESSFHEARMHGEPGGRYEIFVDSAALADRDFELTWQPAAGETPSLRTWVEESNGEYFTLAMIIPPNEDAADRATLPRETIFVIDTSGSMHGDSLSQAKSALRKALERLRPEDSFNLIQFSTQARSLFPTALPVSPGLLEEAQKWIHKLEADGGTNIQAALEQALAEPARSASVRQIVFITDGAVSHETALCAYLEEHLGDSRLFTVGIGSAPNSYFMRKAAEAGRGTFTHIGSLDQVEERMDELLRKLERPVLSNLEALWADPTTVAFPSRLPDLYAGEPLVVIGRAFAPAEELELIGSRGAIAWQREVTLPAPTSHSGLGKLWARRKLGELDDAIAREADPTLLRQEALALALDFQLVSAFTSLVAIDRSPARPGAQPLVPKAIPVQLPAGWSDPGFISGLPATATGWRSSALLSILSLGIATTLLARRSR